MITPILYLILILSDVFQSATTKLFNGCNDKPHAYNFLKSLTAFIIIAIASCVGFTFHNQTIIFAVIHGLVSAISMYAGYKALSKGPIALTSVLVSFSVIIPITWGIIARKEDVSVFQYIAIALLVFSLITMNLDKFKSVNGDKKTNFAWFTFVILTFVFNGVGAILSKEHQLLYPSLYFKEFTTISLFVCVIVHTLIIVITKSNLNFKEIKGKKFGLIGGICTSLLTLVTLLLSATENASVLFPLQTSGKVLGVVLLGYLLFKEKLKLNHFLTIILGLIAVILFKI